MSEQANMAARYEREIPEGYEARIEGNKVILERKESEDEKIRKELIEYLTHRSNVTGFIDEDRDCKRWIAYLERQKEQRSIEDVIKNITKNKETAIKFLKSAGIMDDNGELAEMYRSEKKPADWSEEDEKMLTGIIERGSSQVPPYEPALREEQMAWLMNWLKFLRDNYKKCNSRWKPSEEQMEVLLNTEGLVRANNYPENAKIIASLYDDLKKL